MEWDEALDFAADGLRGCSERHGRDAVATYVGNPSAHSWSLLSVVPLRETLGTPQPPLGDLDRPAARSTARRREMFGNLAMFPIPDLDRTDFMLVLGANPSVSNGSLMTAPGARHRLRDVVARGGTRRRRGPAPHGDGAQLASQHVAVRPGGDAFLLLGHAARRCSPRG